MDATTPNRELAIRASCHLISGGDILDEAMVVVAETTDGLEGGMSDMFGMTSRLINNAETAVGTELEQGERITATLAHASSGMSPWLVSFGAMAAMVGVDLLRYYGIVVTDRRLFLLRYRDRVGFKPTLEATYPKGDVRALSYSPGRLYGKLVVELPGTSGNPKRVLALNMIKTMQEGAQAVAVALQ